MFPRGKVKKKSGLVLGSGLYFFCYSFCVCVCVCVCYPLFCVRLREGSFSLRWVYNISSAAAAALGVLVAVEVVFDSFGRGECITSG